jgi:DNA primase
LIPPNTVQEIVSAAKIEEVVGDFVDLKRRGANRIGLCPFHNEKTPSFVVSPAKNIYKCFGCGAAGDPVKFLMEHEHYSYPEALRSLAAKYNIHVEERQLTPKEIEAKHYEDSLFLINDTAAKFFQDQLLNTDLGKSAGLSYFKRRGYSESIIKKFNLGFVPDVPDSFTSYAIGKGYKMDLLQKLGLTNKYKKDFFKDKVMFTIHNLSGKPIAFAGRKLNEQKSGPKYVNSPENPVYFKSKILYGLNFARKDISRKDVCYLVEGYTDVISLHQAGIENVVASSGTSLTVEQIGLVKRYSPNLTLLFDGDKAGVKAALRGIDLVLEQDMNVKLVMLPEGEDPDSFVKKVGGDAFEDYLLSNAQDFIYFKTKLLKEETKNDPIKKVELIKDLVKSIAKIPDPLKRSVYIKEVGAVMSMEEELLLDQMNGFIKADISNQKKRKEREESRRPGPVNDDVVGPSSGEPAGQKPSVNTNLKTSGQKGAYQERDIIRILILASEFIFDEEEDVKVSEFILSNIEDVINDFDDPLYSKVVKLCYNRFVNGDAINTALFVNNEDESISKLAFDLVQSPFEYSEGWANRWQIYLQTQKMPDDNFKPDSLQALLRFKLHKVTQMCEKNQARIEELSDQEDEISNLMKLLKVQSKLNQIKKELADQLGTVIL